jgi:hypothetical protein
MATPEDILKGVAQAMEDTVPSLTTALSREADPTDNTVEFPHGDITLVSNLRADQWNTDVVGYATDSNGNRVGYLLDAKFDVELQLNIWLAVPSEQYDVQSLGSELERGMRRYDQNRPDPDSLPDGSGGTLTDAGPLRVIGGGELPTQEGANSPLRGYQVTIELRFTDRIDTSEEYGELDYIDSVDIPSDGDLTGGDGDDTEIEFNAS